MKPLFLLVYILFLITFSFSQNKETWGLEFSEEKPNSSGTILYLTDEEPIAFEKQLLIEFDLSILQCNKYGIVVVLHDERNQFQSAIMYYHHTNIDTSFLQLSISGRSTRILIPFEKKNLHRGNWHTMRLNFDCKANKITARCDNVVISDTFYFKQPPAMQIQFAGFENGHDTPPMIIRDIKIAIDDSSTSPQYKHWWKLNEFDGTTATDCIGNIKSKITMPIWNSNNHYYWRERGEITVPYDAGGSFSGTSFSFPSKYVMLEYHILSNKITKTIYSKKRPSRAVYSICIGNTVGIYHGGGGQISVLNKTTNRWSVIDDRFDDDMHFYGSTKFVDTVENKTYSFGGYGWYTTKSLLRQFNFVNLQWDTIPLQNKKQYKERMNVSIAECLRMLARGVTALALN